MDQREGHYKGTFFLKRAITLQKLYATQLKMSTIKYVLYNVQVILLLYLSDSVTKQFGEIISTWHDNLQ